MRLDAAPGKGYAAGDNAKGGVKMESAEVFKNYRDFVSFRADCEGKATLFENEHILVGLNCLEPGQSMEKHAHEVQCRFYLVLEGQGQVWVGDSQQEAGNGMVGWIPAGHPHRIVNTGQDRTVMLVGTTHLKPTDRFLLGKSAPVYLNSF
jgi:quercetin dioxygenase-like cupin family protein